MYTRSELSIDFWSCYIIPVPSHALSSCLTKMTKMEEDCRYLEQFSWNPVLQSRFKVHNFLIIHFSILMKIRFLLEHYFAIPILERYLLKPHLSRPIEGRIFLTAHFTISRQLRMKRKMPIIDWFECRLRCIVHGYPRLTQYDPRLDRKFPGWPRMTWGWTSITPGWPRMTPGWCNITPGRPRMTPGRPRMTPRSQGD